jgi:hypothetical protein
LKTQNIITLRNLISASAPPPGVWAHEEDGKKGEKEGAGEKDIIVLSSGGEEEEKGTKKAGACDFFFFKKKMKHNFTSINLVSGSAPPGVRASREEEDIVTLSSGGEEEEGTPEHDREKAARRLKYGAPLEKPAHWQQLKQSAKKTMPSPCEFLHFFLFEIPEKYMFFFFSAAREGRRRLAKPGHFSLSTM